MLDSLAGYPRWFVAACLVLAGSLVLWLVFKLVKLAMWLLVVGIVVAGLAAAAWVLLGQPLK
jgi:hypothetical protein